jgi:Tripartite tricarboxylate transporter family receptor
MRMVGDTPGVAVMNRSDAEMGSVRGRKSLPSLLLLAATLVFAQAGIARGQTNYPNRPIQLVVTVPPGGAADFVGRLIGAKLADALGQPVVISNRGGAGGTTAAAAVAKSDPDGYTLLLNTIATHGIGPHIYANLPYDPVKDFSPVVLIAKLPLILAVNAELPTRSVQDVIALAKRGRVNSPSARLAAAARRILPANCSKASLEPSCCMFPTGAADQRWSISSRDGSR